MLDNHQGNADVSASIGLGEDYYGEDAPISVEGKFGVNF